MLIPYVLPLLPHSILRNHSLYPVTIFLKFSQPFPNAHLSHLLLITGSPHIHRVISIKNGSTVKGDVHNPSNQYKVLRLVHSKLTAKLLTPRYADGLVKDAQRLHFDPHLDYSLNNNNEPIHDKVHELYRQNQHGSFMHNCTSCCFKYVKKKNERICRFAYPRTLMNEASITETRSKGNSRMRLRVEPQRDHPFLNPLHRSPLLVIAHGSNSDFQYICDERGAVEYW